MARLILVALLLLCPNIAGALPTSSAGLTIYAAASLHNALRDCAALWVRDGHPAPNLRYGATDRLATDLTDGANADLYASTNPAATAALVDRHVALADTLRVLYGNSLVLVGRKGHVSAATIDPTFDMNSVLGPRGRLGIEDAHLVVGGIFAREALQNLQIWDKIATRMVMYPNLISVIAGVQNGDVQAGIVLATDALNSPNLSIIGALPASSHRPVRYEFIATTRGNIKAATDFIAFLNSQAARDIFTGYGFTPP